MKNATLSKHLVYTYPHKGKCWVSVRTRLTLAHFFTHRHFRQLREVLDVPIADLAVSNTTYKKDDAISPSGRGWSTEE
jgi:hypothetical protein